MCIRAVLPTMIRRRGQGSEEEESSSGEDDVFSALSSKQQKGKRKLSIAPSSISNKKQEPAAKKQAVKIPAALTSSMKRHHKTNDSRKAKMDALLVELSAEQKMASATSHQQHHTKSFVDPAEEHLTTNIFVGNLAPSVTEEDLTDLFLQFGDLYSIKIMWPRTEAERNRKRNTGFVCFMNREDAEEAMEACNETDPFNVGRLLMMRWGKNVKKSVRQGSGGGMKIMPIRMEDPVVRQHPLPDKMMMEYDSMSHASMRSDGLPNVITIAERKDISKAGAYDPHMHSANAIKVEILDDPKRFNFISTVAKYVSEDGSSLEKRLIEKEAGNPLFNFLTLNSASKAQRKEHNFYRWRVYSFCQGGGYSTWRTEPFIMFHPYGRFWIPPPLNENVRKRIEPDNESKQREKDKGKGKRRHSVREKDYMTGRQLERARGGRRKGNRMGLSEGRATMRVKELQQFDWLVKKKLTVSRESICQAMAFCFEKSGSAREIADLLKASIVEESPFISVDTKIARLYLLSDILFNSQQPGVKNAFMYRDAIEKMAPEVFTSLGRKETKDGSIGRMTMQKLRTAVSSVLGAWTSWSVYNPQFLDELEARFEGREIKDESEKKEEEIKPEEEKQAEPVEIITNAPRGGWTEVSADQKLDDVDGESVESEAASQTKVRDAIGNSVSPQNNVNALAAELADGTPMDEEAVDGEPVGYVNVDGVPADPDDLKDEKKDAEDIDGDPVDDIDGSAMEDEDLDGEPVDDSNVDGVPADLEDLKDANVDGNELDQGDIDGEEIDVDGEPVDGVPADLEDLKDANIDGEELDQGDVDGEEIDIDGEAMDSHDVDGSPFDKDGVDVDGEEIDGEELDGEEL